jgi:hypothetical protein
MGFGTGGSAVVAESNIPFFMECVLHRSSPTIADGFVGCLRRRT